MRSLLALLVTLPVLLAGSACGLLSDGDDPAEQATGEQAGGDEPGTDSTAESETFTLDESFWHAGFMVTIHGGTLGPEPAGADLLLSLDATFTNLGPEQATFGSQIAVESGGASFPTGWDTELPSVPSDLSTPGTLVFEVRQGFELAGAALIVGNERENQARVPLGPAGGDLVALEPSEPAVTGVLSTAPLDMTITAAELRADVPVLHRSVERGKWALTLYMTATSRKSGNWSIQASHFALVTPGGSGVGVDGSQLGSLPGADGGVETPGLYVRFLVDDPPAGDYTLRMSLPNYWDSAQPEGTLEFTLP